MNEETIIIVQKSDQEKAFGTVGTSRAKITNNPLGAIGGGFWRGILQKDTQDLKTNGLMQESF